MKKLISIVLCMAMLLSCFALFALAVEETEPVSQSLAPAPTIDGVVNPEEYTTSKVWSHADNFANSNAITSGKTLTEYVAHSDDYVYIAFVSTEDVSNFIFYLNASEYILTDFDQCGITSQLRFDLSTQDENTAPTTYYDRHSSITTENNLPNTLRGLEADEYSAYAKRNKDGETFANVTVEIKISKAAMMEIFEVDSVEHFGYYVDGTKADGSGHYINTRKFTGTTTYTEFSSIGQFETTYGVDRGEYYASQSRVLNFVIFGEAPDPVHYCPVGCTCEGVTRSTEFSLADITQWNQLPSTYVTTKVAEVQAQTKDVPTIDGVVDPEEYTTSKVWSHADNFANSNAITSGKTLTEYVAHSDDYVYIAFVSTEDVSNFKFYLNASEYILTDFDQCGITSQLIFDLSTQDENTTPTTYYDRHSSITTENNLPNTLRGLTSGEYETYAKRNKEDETFANVTVEIKISKAAMMEIFEVDSVEYFGYYVDGTKADGSGHYINTRKFTGTTTYTEFSSITEFETTYGVNRGAYYASQSRVLNFVIFGEEPAPYHYCPTTCTCEGVTRSTEFSLTDITQWNQQPSTYVTTKVLEAQSNDAPTIDGAVNVDEYTTSKVWSHADNFANNNAITSGKTLTEYVAHSEDCVYIAFVSTEDVKEFTFYLNASESILTDFDQAGILSTLYFNLDGQDKNTVPVVDSKVYSSVTSTPVASLRGLNADEYQAYARRNKVDGEFANVTVEIKISKAAMMEIFEVDSVEYFGYYVDGAKADDSGHYVNSRKFTGTTTYTEFSSMSEFETLYGVNRGTYYTNQSEGGRILNFVIFDEEPAPYHYCPTTCTCEGVTRSTEFSLTDITQWNQLPSTYLTDKLVESQVKNAPTVNGAVNLDEYTTSKVWSHADNFANNNAITSGKTLTEYVACGDDYIYIAFVSTEDVKEFTFYLNASESILTDFDQAGILSTLAFSLDGQDKNTAPVADSKVYSSVTSTPVATLRALNADEYSAYAKRNYNGNTVVNVTVEIKISKAAMMEIFEVDSVEYFGYYVDGAKADDSGHYVNSRKFTGTTTYTEFSSMSEFETLYGVNRGTYYTNQSEGGRILNFVIFDEEPAPYHYCPTTCTCEGVTRSTEFSLTDITQWNQLPSTYLTATVVDAPEEEEPAAPQDPTAPPEPSSTPVKGTYVEGSGAVDTYSVEVTFGSMQFTYRDFDKAWDTSNHVETNVAGTARWYCDTDANKITVTNHSNVAVTATLSYDATNNDVSGSFGNNSTLNLATAFGTTYEQAPTASAYLTLSGTYSGAEDTFVKVGTVTVTITKQQ